MNFSFCETPARHLPPHALVPPGVARRTFRTAIVSLGLLGVMTLAAQPRYSVVDLGTLGGIASDAHDLNENGEVVGQAQTGIASNHHAFVYRDGRMHDLGTLPGGNFSVAHAINAAGQVVGSSTSNSSAQRAVIFANGTVTALMPLDPAFASNDSAALGLNDYGQIVGFSTVPAPDGSGPVARAFVYANGLVSDLGSAAPTVIDSRPDATALGVTNAGLIIGRTVNTASLSLPARGWTYSAGAMDLLPLPADPAYNATELADANASGVIVGTAVSLAGGGPRPPERGFIFAAGSYTFIAALDGDSGTNARGINSAGDVVGNSFDGVRNRAFLRTGGTTFDLNALTLLADSGFTSLDIARRINDRGQIVGVGTTRSGAPHAFLLTPVAAAAPAIPSAQADPAAPIPVAITIDDLVHNYDGAIHVARVASNPALPVHGDPTGTLIVYYNDRTAYGLANGPDGAPYALYPSHPGEHTVRVEVYSDQQLYSGSATATLRIVPTPVTISLGNLDQAYDGSPKAVTVACTPATAVQPEGAGIAPMDVTITYDGNAAPPSAPGLYSVVATVRTYGYTGSATGTLAITAPVPPPADVVPVTPPPPIVPPPPTTPPVKEVSPEATGRDNAARLANVSTRGRAGTATEPLIAGFVISGEAPHQVLIRAVGPGLLPFGVGDAVAAPRLAVFRGDNQLAQNQRWGTADNASKLAATATSVGAFKLAPGSADAALLTTLEPGAYTAVLTNADSTVGGALIEIYDASAGSSRLVNLSTRGTVGPGDHVMIAGLVVNGTAPKRLLVRAVGPSLSEFGVGTALRDPRLRIFRDEELQAENAGWNGNVDVTRTGSAIGAFPLVSGSMDAALVVTLPPGAYTAVVDSQSGASGTVLLEIYESP